MLSSKLILLLLINEDISFEDCLKLLTFRYMTFDFRFSEMGYNIDRSIIKLY